MGPHILLHCNLSLCLPLCQMLLRKNSPYLGTKTRSWLWLHMNSSARHTLSLRKRRTQGLDIQMKRLSPRRVIAVRQPPSERIPCVSSFFGEFAFLPTLRDEISMIYLLYLFPHPVGHLAPAGPSNQGLLLQI